MTARPRSCRAVLVFVEGIRGVESLFNECTALKQLVHGSFKSCTSFSASVLPEKRWDTQFAPILKKADDAGISKHILTGGRVDGLGAALKKLQSVHSTEVEHCESQCGPDCAAVASACALIKSHNLPGLLIVELEQLCVATGCPSRPDVYHERCVVTAGLLGDLLLAVDNRRSDLGDAEDLLLFICSNDSVGGAHGLWVCSGGSTVLPGEILPPPRARDLSATLAAHFGLCLDVSVDSVCRGLTKRQSAQERRMSISPAVQVAQPLPSKRHSWEPGNHTAGTSIGRIPSRRSFFRGLCPAGTPSAPPYSSCTAATTVHGALEKYHHTRDLMFNLEI